MSSKTNQQQSFDMKSLICEKVVVFTDRAEVRRVLKATLNKGENEIVLTNVSNLVDEDSIRVEGHGAATVLDVIFQKKRVQTEQVDTHEKAKELQSEQKELEIVEQQLKLKKQRNEKQLDILNEFAKTLSKKSDNSTVPSSSSSSVNENIDSFLTFLGTYGKRIEDLDNEIFNLNQELSKNQEKLNVVKENLRKLNISNFNEIVEITILIEAEKDKTEVTLNLSYVIENASWTPKYDIRVFSDNKSMTINYYGMIKQSTGEDWNDTQLSLSTAVPSIGGNVPELTTLNLRILRPVYNYSSKMKSRKMKSSFMLPLGGSADYYSSPECDLSAEMAPVLEDAVANVKEGLTASTFDIPRQATIPADNNTHKVSIGIINLKPEFEYETVPKKSPHAFLKAKVKNTSSYAMLAGPANVFLDNNFVAKTQLKSYSPQEEFTCSLGVDPSIRIDYKPVRKFQEQSGIISKTKSTTYVQLIEINNTNSSAIKLLLSDQLPLSNDDKIQVKLIEPTINKNSQTIKLNKLNNIEFDLKIEAAKKLEITIKYAIEHPAQEEIEFV